MKEEEAILALKEAQLRKGHVRSTRKMYRHWLCRYIAGSKDGVYSDLQGFFDHLTNTLELNPKTIRQALNAMVFFYKNVLEKDPGILNVPKANKNRNEPDWLHHHEVMAILSRMRGLARLQAAFLYATGSRIGAMLKLRLKDLDIHGKTVRFRFDKGRKTRTVRIGDALMPFLNEQVEWAKSQWQTDQSKGVIAGCPEPSLERKLGKATFAKLPWYWLFPSASISKGRRWHMTSRCISTALAKATSECGIMKRVTPHTLRHSHATALLNRGENIITIRDQMGHTDVKTTEIYSHTTAQYRPDSPLVELGDMADIIPMAPIKATG